MQILVVEDESAIADFVERGLREEGFAVSCVGDGVEGERRALADDVDLVILDRMLPGRDGIEVLASIRRSRPGLPVIMLTARTEVADRVEGLEQGATDYVTKPFALAELVARVKAHLRQPPEGRLSTVSAAGMELDLISRTVRRDGHSIRLAEREADLLAFLMKRAGRVCTREEILASVWGYDHDPGTNVVQVYVGYLRRRLRLAGSPAPIETVRSVGYRLAERE
jgi:DNA-binding response OmpR family regulator